MSSVLLATFALMPGGEPGGELLVSALADRGADAQWASWDDPDVDWASADVVAVRSTWDYSRRLPDFLAWARKVDGATRLLNGAEVFAWNADKSYLMDLVEDVPVVPTALLDDDALLTGLRDALAQWPMVVVKPRTGAGGVGVVVAESEADPRLGGLTAGPWLVQPLMESVRTHGETSVFVLGGESVSQVDKIVAGDEVRVHERYGGSSRRVALEPGAGELAEGAVRAAAARCAAELSYARVDLMRDGGGWLVSEVELIEPGLYLDVEPANADRFADVIAKS